MDKMYIPCLKETELCSFLASWVWAGCAELSSRSRLHLSDTLMVRSSGVSSCEIERRAIYLREKSHL